MAGHANLGWPWLWMEESQMPSDNRAIDRARAQANDDNNSHHNDDSMRGGDG